jgi:hypothetical protein
MNPRKKVLSFGVVALAALLTCEMGSTSFAAPVDAGAPRIEFASTNLDISRVAAGWVTNYDFVFTNTGNQTLEITEVQPTCGCTMAGKWDPRVEPGQAGHIPIRFTASYVGGEISKTIIVYCNDPARTNVVLHINGSIWEPVEVKPVYLMFGANSDRVTNETQVVRIINNSDEPLTVSNPKSTDPSYKAELKTIKPGREFELQVTLTPPLTPGNYNVQITAETSSTILPVIHITVFAAVSGAVMATPAQIALPAKLSPTGTVFSVTIKNDGIKPLPLPEARINDSRVGVKVQETRPGREFVVTATFPRGFTANPDQHIELQVKTSHPQFPVLKIPIYQLRSLADILSAEGNNDTGTPPAKAKK